MFKNIKLILGTLALSAAVLAALALAVVAIPIVTGLFVVLAVYALLRILTEDVD